MISSATVLQLHVCTAIHWGISTYINRKKGERSQNQCRLILPCCISWWKYGWPLATGKTSIPANECLSRSITYRFFVSGYQDNAPYAVYSSVVIRDLEKSVVLQHVIFVTTCWNWTSCCHRELYHKKKLTNCTVIAFNGALFAIITGNSSTADLLIGVAFSVGICKRNSIVKEDIW